jgi:hypothetical protein
MALDEVRLKLVAAGIPDAAIPPGKAPDDGIDILVLSPTDQMLATADRAAMAKLHIDSQIAFDFATEKQRVAFAPFLAAEYARRDREAAITALSQEGKLDKVPRFDGKEPMSAFAHRLEQSCGYEPGRALRVVDLHWLEFDTPSLGRETAVAQAEGRSIESFWCLKRVIDATSLGRHFIGNRFRNPDDAT